MNPSRRNFLKTGLITLAGLSVPLGALEFLTPKAAATTVKDSSLRWVFLVDATKCIGCGMCVKACLNENELPTSSHYSRTWVERYVVTQDGQMIVDSPMQARAGYIRNDPRGKEIPKENIAKGFFVPKLCNQCDLPVCVDVCPAGATYKTPDGVVHVDRKWCIGCAACISNCPYGARFFHPTLHVVEKCNFCYHRITKGLQTACVDSCAFGARKIGNIKDPNDPVTKTILTERVAVLKPEYGSKPQIFYLGLSQEVK
ncbi:MAG TPA: 4Fe-4S dicluster domain-containing protein [Dissulfurispiraceae bacterium]|nr:4Fe-4S dicluster domain-containing protein [Dissulfurispiraceae bacterium]